MKSLKDRQRIRVIKKKNIRKYSVKKEVRLMTVEGLERICPFCSQDNNCQHGQGGCWCETVNVPIQLLERVPENKKEKVGICKLCIEKFNENFR